MYKLILLLLLCSITTHANAYLITSFYSNEIDYSQPTRLLIAGDGHDLGLLFQEVAKSKALKYHELNPDYQIILITAEEKELDNKQALKRWGFNLQDEKRSSLDGESFLKEAIKFKKIASIDIFSHSSAQHGIHLDGRSNRLDLTTKGVAQLRSHFIKDAYAYLHGCNSGFYMAPFLSKEWEIPVAGSMTSTNFQKLHNSGDFYLTDPGLAPDSEWKTANDLTFLKTIDCRDGACMRLKPDNHPYVGFWGEYTDGGLPFYKFFCVKNSTQDCERVMAKSLLSFIGTTNLNSKSSFTDYKKVAIDFLCPINAKRELRKECEENLESALLTGDETYNPFSKALLECDFKKCKAEVDCTKVLFTKISKPGTCGLKITYPGQATTLVREYKSYLQGFKSL